MLMIKSWYGKKPIFWSEIPLSYSRYTDAILNVVTSSVAVVNAIHSWFSRKRQPEKTEQKKRHNNSIHW